MGITTKTKVICGFITALLLSAGGCLLSYRYLQSVSGAVVKLSRENARDKALKAALYTLDSADAEVDNYILCRRGGKLDTVNTLLTDLVIQSGKVRLICENIPSQAKVARHIDSLINSQVNWYYGFISFKNLNEGDLFLSNLTAKINKLYSPAEPVKAVSAPADKEPRAKKGFFSRIFGDKKNQDEPVTEPKLNQAPDLRKTSARITSIIKEAKDIQDLNEKNTEAREIALLQEGRFIKQQLKMQVSLFERNEALFTKGEAVKLRAETDNAVVALGILTTMGGVALILFSLFIVRDITRSNRLKAELIQARSEALDFARAKEEFLANMSHEIRTPLNSIIGFAEQLNSTRGNDHERYARAIQKSSHHLLNLVNDILDFSKINLGKINLEKISFEIKEVLDDTAEIFRAQAIKKGLSFNCVINDDTRDLVALGDPHRLKQILLNLVGNAVKFTEKGSVTIHTGHTPAPDGFLLWVKVSDTGIGIDQKNLGKIFNSFDQADNSITRKFGGTGLGLSICKQLARLQGGEIEVSSTPGRGSEFTLSIPYQTGNPDDIWKDTPMPGLDNYTANQPKNVLIVDDDEMSMLLMSTILEKNGIKHKTANDGKDAILKLKTNRFDLVLTDINMPEISGLDLLRFIKKDERSTMPVIAITANANSNDLEKYKACGFDSILLKPYLEENLLALIYKELRMNIPDKKNNGMAHKGYEKSTSFSVDELSRISNGSEEFIVKMLEKFITSVNDCSHSMQLALATSDWKTLAAMAHKIIPSCSMMGLKDLVPRLQDVEQKARNGTVNAAVKESVEWIIEYNRKTVKEIEAYLQKLSEKK